MAIIFCFFAFFLFYFYDFTLFFSLSLSLFSSSPLFLRRNRCSFTPIWLRDCVDVEVENYTLTKSNNLVLNVDGAIESNRGERKKGKERTRGGRRRRGEELKRRERKKREKSERINLEK